jgi:ankyrin repeat protein
LKLIRNGSDVNTKCKNDYLLHIATEQGHTMVVKTLLEEKVITDCIGDAGATPLYIACQNGFIEIARALVARGADVNFSLPNGNTPLYIAITYGHTEVVKLLLAHGAKINQKVGTNTPLNSAIIKGRLDLVILLVESGAVLSNVCQNNSSLEFARLMLQKDIFEYFSRKVRTLYQNTTSDEKETNPNLFFHNNVHEPDRKTSLLNPNPPSSGIQV